MPGLLLEFVPLFLFCCLGFYLIKVVYSFLGKMVQAKTDPRSRLHRTSGIFARIGPKMKAEDCILMGLFTILWMNMVG